MRPSVMASSVGAPIITAASAVTWFEFARTIVEDSGVLIAPIAAKDYPRPAVRHCTRIWNEQPDWRIALRKVREALRER
jgi:dTDP-4-dehydrorhamnose reductase